MNVDWNHISSMQCITWFIHASQPYKYAHIPSDRLILSLEEHTSQLNGMLKKKKKKKRIWTFLQKLILPPKNKIVITAKTQVADMTVLFLASDTE